MKKIILGLAAAAGLMSAQAQAVNCYILVHGRQDNQDTYNSYTAARNYWIGQNTNMFNMGSGATFNGPSIITKNGAHKHYIASYDGTRGYQQAAVQVARHLGNAMGLNPANPFYSSNGWGGGYTFGGGKDGGGNSCAGASKYVLVFHSMGGTIAGFILGNARTTDPNYNFQGAPFRDIANKIIATNSRVYTLSSPLRGAQAADAIEGKDSWFANLISSFISKSTESTVWLQTASNRQLATYSSSPLVPVYMLSGSETMASSVALNGSDDGVITIHSSHACAGDPLTSASDSSICRDSQKMKPSGYYNISAADENHSDVRNGSDTDKRKYTAENRKCVSRICKNTILGITVSKYPCSNSIEEISCMTP